MLSELPPGSRHVRSVFHYSASPLVLRITAFGSEQFHGELWPNNATRLPRIDWLWSVKRASVWVTGGGPPPGQSGEPTHAHLHHGQGRKHARPRRAGRSE